jgi:hypothetical protein
MLRAIANALVEALLWPIGVIVALLSWLYMKIDKPSGPQGSAYAIVLPMLALMSLGEILHLPQLMKFLRPQGDE